MVTRRDSALRFALAPAISSCRYYSIPFPLARRRDPRLVVCTLRRFLDVVF